MKQNLDRFKMRFFDTKRQFMAQVRHYDLMCNYAVVSYSYADEYTPDEEVELSDGILMQCTGLKDKNGKLIYEGDLIGWTLIYDDGTEEPEDCDFTQIQFRDAMFCFVMNAGMEQREYYEALFIKHGIWEPDFEIIGNIYENQEFLKNN